MVAKLSTEDIEALNLKDAFAEKQTQQGSIAGAGSDFAGDVSNYLSKMFSANLADAIGRKTLARGKLMDKSAGAGANERLAAVTGQRMAAARTALDTAAQQAAMDPTGAAAAQLGRDIQTVTQRAGDSSKELTAEMDVALKQKALAEQIKSRGEEQKMLAKQEKQQNRLGLVTSAIQGGVKLAQAIQPQTYEAKLGTTAERQKKKAARLGKRVLKTDDAEKRKTLMQKRTSALEKSIAAGQELDAITAAEYKKLQLKAGAKEGTTDFLADLLAGIKTVPETTGVE
jgi:hypothetical protein|tara:strand:+ start:15794 stop:16648 length:855 start_codon:yes stop_codon:yes gene_type:complete